jgi:hypothetical protein
MMVAGMSTLGHLLAHSLPVVTVEAVAFDDRGVEPLTPENVLEGARDGRRSGTRRTGDRDDWILDRHEA